MNNIDGIIPQNLVTSDSGSVSFDAAVMRFDDPNINGRVYSSSLIPEIQAQMSDGLPLAIASYGGLDLSAMPDIVGSVELVSFDDNRMNCKVRVAEEFSNLVGDYLNHVYPCFFAETIDNVVQPGLRLIGFCIEHIDIQEDEDDTESKEAES